MPVMITLLFRILTPFSASISLAASLFTPEPWMKNDVEFWVSIFTRYGAKQSVIHDTEYLDKVFEVTSPHRASARIEYWQSVLRNVHEKRAAGKATLTEDERKAESLYTDIRLSGKYLAAAQKGRLRAQLGQKERFFHALMDSGRYLAHMEKIFAEEGLPIELTRIPFVESSFQLHARSHVGALGVWQFMPETARAFMRVDAIADERDDPILSSRAAAKLLKSNYARLGSWPLAVMAYNHGTAGVERAVQKVGSKDFRLLWKHYLGPGFGFASRNFYFELLAAIEIEREPMKFFGRVDRAPTMQFQEVMLIDSVHVSDLIRFYGFDADEFRLMNRGLSQKVYDGRVRIPAGFRLRVPMEARAFYERYKAFPKVLRASK